jgi:hypothetical protein
MPPTWKPLLCHDMSDHQSVSHFFYPFPLPSSSHPPPLFLSIPSLPTHRHQVAPWAHTDNGGSVLRAAAMEGAPSHVRWELRVAAMEGAPPQARQELRAAVEGSPPQAPRELRAAVEGSPPQVRRELQAVVEGAPPRRGGSLTSGHVRELPGRCGGAPRWILRRRSEGSERPGCTVTRSKSTARWESSAPPPSGSMRPRGGKPLYRWSRGSSLRPQEKGPEGSIWLPSQSRGLSWGPVGVRFCALAPYLLSWGSSRGSTGVALSSYRAWFGSRGPKFYNDRACFGRCSDDSMSISRQLYYNLKYIYIELRIVSPDIQTDWCCVWCLDFCTPNLLSSRAHLPRWEDPPSRLQPFEQTSPIFMSLCDVLVKQWLMCNWLCI